MQIRRGARTGSIAFNSIVALCLAAVSDVAEAKAPDALPDFVNEVGDPLTPYGPDAVDAQRRGDANALLRIAEKRPAMIAGSDKTSLDLYSAACGAGSTFGCVVLGMHFESGSHVTASRDRAEQLYRYACDRDQALGCVALGRSFEKNASEPKHLTAATGLYVLGCRLGSVAGCSSAAQMYALGYGVEKDWDIARDFLDEAFALEPSFESAKQLRDLIGG